MTNSRSARYATRRLARQLIDFVASRLPSQVGGSASLVLAYHNIVPESMAGNGDASLHLPLERFQEQLALIPREADLVDLPTLLAERERPGRRVAVTFDDAYRGFLLHGLPACASAQVAPTVFVAPGLYGATPIWDLLAQRGEWSELDRSQFLTKRRGIQIPTVETVTSLPREYSVATLDEIQQASTRYPMHIGNHSFSHANLGSLDGRHVAEEVQRAALQLAAFDNVLIPVLAYPYGIAPAPEVRAALSPSCEAAFVVDGGWMEPANAVDRFLLPRLNIPAGLSSAGFHARLRGRLNAKRSL